MTAASSIPQDPLPPPSQTFEVTSFNFGKSQPFESQDPSTLVNTKYTLAVICIDLSGSVFHFQEDLKKCLQNIIMACRAHTQKSMMMLAIVGFQGTSTIDILGFTQVEHINVQAVLDQIHPNYSTPLYDGMARGCEILETYAKVLSDEKSFTVNGIIFVLTDGEENSSTRASIDDIDRAIKRMRPQDDPNFHLESLLTLAVGVGVDLPLLQSHGWDFRRIAEATTEAIRDWGSWVSSMIQSQSQAIGSGSPSTILPPDFT